MHPLLSMRSIHLFLLSTVGLSTVRADVVGKSQTPSNIAFLFVIAVLVFGREERFGGRTLVGKPGYRDGLGSSLLEQGESSTLQCCALGLGLYGAMLLGSCDWYSVTQGSSRLLKFVRSRTYALVSVEY